MIEDEFIESHIQYIRRMALLDDNSLRAILKMKISQDRSVVERFKEEKMKRELNEMSSLAKSFKPHVSTNKLARKVA